MEHLWSDALSILNGDEREWKQMIPRDLDDEEFYGREHVRALLAMRTSFRKGDKFIRIVRSFLLVITHSSFLDCLSVDTFVGGLYSFIAGTNGTRAVPFFQCLCETLVNIHVDTISLTAISETVDTTLAATTLDATAIALRELLRRESRARFNDDLPILLDSMEAIIEAFRKEAQSLVILRQIGEIRAMVARATGLLVHEQDHWEAPTPATSSYPRASVMPRDRHDNDNEDITKIKIFPTGEEILSDEAEFLPSTNFDQPHFLANQAERHIDTHFRLLRHDTFGELKDYLRGVMYALKNDPLGPKLGLGDFRANQYADASISYIFFDSRRGLGMNISFTQPPIARGKNTAERRRWWEESKRLSEGVLMSFVSLHQGEMQHLFFTVTEKNTDASKDHGLSNQEHRGTITAKLASENQGNVESAVRLGYQKAKGLLIEFPGILPSTFIPILENLQDMQRLSRLPFRQWILPDKISDTVEAVKFDLPPPLYARKPGFSFSLKPLLKSNGPQTEDIRIHSTNDLTIIDEMERRTNLDRGQCRGLLAALTQEYAFIQGPPGTGKSFLGIQLMRVLMHCKDIANLGPVVVV